MFKCNQIKNPGPQLYEPHFESSAAACGEWLMVLDGEDTELSHHHRHCCI